MFVVSSSLNFSTIVLPHSKRLLRVFVNWVRRKEQRQLLISFWSCEAFPIISVWHSIFTTMPPCERDTLSILSFRRSLWWHVHTGICTCIAKSKPHNMCRLCLTLCQDAYAAMKQWVARNIRSSGWPLSADAQLRPTCMSEGVNSG